MIRLYKLAVWTDLDWWNGEKSWKTRLKQNQIYTSIKTEPIAWQLDSFGYSQINPWEGVLGRFLFSCSLWELGPVWPWKKKGSNSMIWFHWDRVTTWTNYQIRNLWQDSDKQNRTIWQDRTGMSTLSDRTVNREGIGKKPDRTVSILLEARSLAYMVLYISFQMMNYGWVGRWNKIWIKALWFPFKGLYLKKKWERWCVIYSWEIWAGLQII
jgi:hypothetical protein